MVNNVARTTKTLSTTLGGTVTFTPSDNLTIMTGELGTGLLIFDSAGTLGVVTTFVDDESNFTVTTYAISIDVQTLLEATY